MTELWVGTEGPRAAFGLSSFGHTSCREAAATRMGCPPQVSVSRGKGTVRTLWKLRSFYL